MGLAGWSRSARVGKVTSLIASSRRAVAQGGASLCSGGKNNPLHRFIDHGPGGGARRGRGGAASLCSGGKSNPLHSFLDHGLGSGHAVGRRDGLALIGWHARRGRKVVSIGLARRLGRQCGLRRGVEGLRRGAARPHLRSSSGPGSRLGSRLPGALPLSSPRVDRSPSVVSSSGSSSQRSARLSRRRTSASRGRLGRRAAAPLGMRQGQWG